MPPQTAQSDPQKTVDILSSPSFRNASPEVKRRVLEKMRAEQPTSASTDASPAPQKSWIEENIGPESTAGKILSPPHGIEWLLGPGLPPILRAAKLGLHSAQKPLNKQSEDISNLESKGILEPSTLRHYPAEFLKSTARMGESFADPVNALLAAISMHPAGRLAVGAYSMGRGGYDALRKRQPNETLPDYLERVLMGGSMVAGGAAGAGSGRLARADFSRGPMSEAGRINKMSYAAGGTGEIADNLKKALPDLAETSRRTGIEPKTPQEFLDNVKASERYLNNEYAVALQEVAGEINVPTKVSQALRAEADNLPSAAADEARDLRELATEYEKPRTVRDMDKERMWRNSRAEAYYKKGELGQMSASQKASTASVDKLIATTLRDIIYDDVMGEKFPGARELKQRQGALLRIKDTLAERVPELRSAQAAAEGSPISERVSVTAYGTPTKIRPSVHGGNKLFPRWRGPEVKASSAVKSGFKGIGKAGMVREAVRLRAQGKTALADVLEKEAGATDLQKAKATISHINGNPEPSRGTYMRDPRTHEQILKGLDELGKGGQGKVSTQEPGNPEEE